MPWPLRVVAIVGLVLTAPVGLSVLLGALIRDLFSRPTDASSHASGPMSPPPTRHRRFRHTEPAPVGVLAALPQPRTIPAAPAALRIVDTPQGAPVAAPHDLDVDLHAPGLRILETSDTCDWDVVSLGDIDRLGAYALEHGIAWDVGELQALSREGGFLWRDLLASGAGCEALEQAAREQLAVDPAGTTRQVVALMWHLMARGLEKQQGFAEGAFTCDDPELKLGSFLRGLGYPRLSSHLAHDGGCTFGIDVTTRDVGLPAKHRHVLCKMYRGPDGRTRLFIKPEAWGVRGLVAFTGHALDYLASVARKMSPMFGSDSEPGMRKERIPKALVAEYAWIIQGLDGARESLARVGSSGRGEGLAAMIAYLHVQVASPDRSAPRADVMQRFMNRLEDAYDHLDVRIGAEVIVKPPEVAPDMHGPVE